MPYAHYSEVGVFKGYSMHPSAYGDGKDTVTVGIVEVRNTLGQYTPHLVPVGDITFLGDGPINPLELQNAKGLFHDASGIFDADSNPPKLFFDKCTEGYDVE